MDKYIPAAQASIEYEVNKSLFIAAAAPVFSLEEARSFISERKKKYQDASHNVSAFIIGTTQIEASGSNDDGEPSGTAGKPILAVLAGSDFTNISVVVTRYFGGVKLGTGGLLRAYSESAKRVLSILGKKRLEIADRFKIFIRYSFYDSFQSLCGRRQARISRSDFSDMAALIVEVKSSEAEDFLKELENMTGGSARILVEERNTAVYLEI